MLSQFEEETNKEALRAENELLREQAKYERFMRATSEFEKQRILEEE